MSGGDRRDSREVSGEKRHVTGDNDNSSCGSSSNNNNNSSSSNNNNSNNNSSSSNNSSSNNNNSSSNNNNNNNNININMSKYFPSLVTEITANYMNTNSRAELTLDFKSKTFKLLV